MEYTEIFTIKILSEILNFIPPYHGSEDRFIQTQYQINFGSQIDFNHQTLSFGI